MSRSAGTRVWLPQPALAAPVASKPEPSVDLHDLMLDVVAEKTGYPKEMLELEMDIEAELGIDSIKRVEILAAVQSRAPGLPEIDATHMERSYAGRRMTSTPRPSRAPLCAN